MKGVINKLLFTHLVIPIHNQIYIICFWCKATSCSYQDVTYKSLIDFYDKHTPKINDSEIYVVAADSFFTQDAMNDIFNLPNDCFIPYQYHMFESFLKNFGAAIYKFIGDNIRNMLNEISQGALILVFIGHCPHLFFQPLVFLNIYPSKSRMIYKGKYTCKQFMLRKSHGERGKQVSFAS